MKKIFPTHILLNKDYILDRVEHIKVHGLDSPFILKNLSKEEIILFSEQEAFIWTTLKRNSNLKELTFRFFSVFETLSFDWLEKILKEWEDRNLIINIKHKHHSNKFNLANFIVKVINFKIYLPFLAELINYSYNNLFKYFINSFFVTALLIFGITGNFLFISEIAFKQTNFLKKDFDLKALLLILTFSFISIFIHEFAHGLILNKFKIKARLVGIKLYNLIPLFFVDVTESWTLSRNKRILITVAGVFSNFLITSITTFLFIFSSESSKLLIAYFALINFLNCILNLIPFIKLDGYYLLIDFIGTSNVISQALKTLNKLLTGEKIYPQDYNYIVFAVFYYITLIFFIYLTLTSILNIASNLYIIM